MGQFFDEVPEGGITDWIKAQKIFFVATAALSPSHHVNVSPKGYATFTLDSPNACWYQDLTGSGNETVSHLRENGRMTLMFVAFEGAPRILRLFGYGKVFERGTKEYERLLPPGDPRILPGSRAIIWMDIHKVGTSCGYSVPFFDYVKERTLLCDRMAKREEYDVEHAQDPPQKQHDKNHSIRAYWKASNARSMDGLPGLDLGLRGSPSIHTKPSAAVLARQTTKDLMTGMLIGAVLTLVALSWAQDGNQALDRLKSSLQFVFS